MNKHWLFHILILFFQPLKRGAGLHAFSRSLLKYFKTLGLLCEISVGKQKVSDRGLTVSS